MGVGSEVQGGKASLRKRSIMMHDGGRVLENIASESGWVRLSKANL